MFTIFSEIFTDATITRWFYGNYRDRNKANMIAMALNRDCALNVEYCVVPYEDALEFNIHNMEKIDE